MQRLTLAKPACKGGGSQRGQWSKGGQAGSQVQRRQGFRDHAKNCDFRPESHGKALGMLRKGVMQTDSHLELIMLGGEWRWKASWEGEDNSLDQGNGKHWRKDTGSRDTQAVTQNVVLGPEHDCEGDGKVGFQAVFVHVYDGATGGDRNTSNGADLGRIPARLEHIGLESL